MLPFFFFDFLVAFLIPLHRFPGLPFMYVTSAVLVYSLVTALGGKNVKLWVSLFIMNHSFFKTTDTLLYLTIRRRHYGEVALPLLSRRSCITEGFFNWTSRRVQYRLLHCLYKVPLSYQVLRQRPGLCCLQEKRKGSIG